MRAKSWVVTEAENLHFSQHEGRDKEEKESSCATQTKSPEENGLNFSPNSHNNNPLLDLPKWVEPKMKAEIYKEFFFTDDQNHKTTNKNLVLKEERPGQVKPIILEESPVLLEELSFLGSDDTQSEISMVEHYIPEDELGEGKYGKSPISLLTAFTSGESLGCFQTHFFPCSNPGELLAKKDFLVKQSSKVKLGSGLEKVIICPVCGI